MVVGVEELVAILGNPKKMGSTAGVQVMWAVEAQKDSPGTCAKLENTCWHQKLGFYFGETWESQIIVSKGVKDQNWVLSLKLS